MGWDAGFCRGSLSGVLALGDGVPHRVPYQLYGRGIDSVLLRGSLDALQGFGQHSYFLSLVIIIFLYQPVVGAVETPQVVAGQDLDTSPV